MTRVVPQRQKEKKHSNKAVIKNNLWKIMRPYFALHSSHRHVKGFFFEIYSGHCGYAPYY